MASIFEFQVYQNVQNENTGCPGDMAREGTWGFVAQIWLVVKILLLQVAMECMDNVSLQDKQSRI